MLVNHCTGVGFLLRHGLGGGRLGRLLSGAIVVVESFRVVLLLLVVVVVAAVVCCCCGCCCVVRLVVVVDWDFTMPSCELASSKV